MKMRKFLVGLTIMCALSVSAAACTGCAAVQAWWQTIQSNPVLAIQMFLQATQVVLNLAVAAFNGLLPLLPAAEQGADQVTFNKVVTAANDAIRALTDAEQIAIQQQTPNPDFSKEMQAVTDAVQAVVDMVATLASKQQAAAGTTAKVSYPSFAEMNNALMTMKRVGHTK